MGGRDQIEGRVVLRTVCGTTTLSLVIYTGGRDNPNPVVDRNIGKVLTDILRESMQRGMKSIK